MLSYSTKVFLGVAICVLPSPAWSWDRDYCLNEWAANDIANRWLSLNAALDKTAAAALVTDDVTVEDETINFGVGQCVLPPEGPYVFNKQGLLMNFDIRAQESTVNNQQYVALKIVHDCNSIAIRWQGTATAKGGIPNMYQSPSIIS